MSTFADLLTEYMARVGIGDAEMARRVGVSRLTLIRWKEGVTSRPRYREDVSHRTALSHVKLLSSLNDASYLLGRP